MKTKIQLIKLFTKVEEGDQFRPSLITYSKRPYELKNVNVGNGLGNEVVTKSEHWLHVKLWLIEFNISWIK